MDKYNDMTYEELLKAKDNLYKQKDDINREYRTICQVILQKDTARFTELIGQYVKCVCGNEDSYYLMKITDVDKEEIKGVGVWCYKDGFSEYNFDYKICIEQWEWRNCVFTQLTVEEYKSLVKDILNNCRERVM